MDATHAFAELGDYKDSQKLMATSVYHEISLTLEDEDGVNIFYDDEQELLTFNLYLSTIDPELYTEKYFKDFIRRYGEEAFEEAVSDLHKDLWEEFNYTFEEYEIDIPFQVCLYKSKDSSAPLGSYAGE